MQEERKKLLDSILEESNKMVIEKTWPVTEDELVEHSGISSSFEFGFICGFLHCKKQMIRKAKLKGWVARDEDGSLRLFEVEPRRLEDKHRWWDRDYQATDLDESEFPDLEWEDEPIYVKLIIAKEG